MNNLAHIRPTDAPIADALAAAEAALTAATERQAEARAKLAEVDALVSDAQQRRGQLVEQAASGTAPELGKIREAAGAIQDAVDVRGLVADALKAADDRVVDAENALRAVLINQCRTAHAQAAAFLAEAEVRKAAATETRDAAWAAEQAAARVLATCIVDRLTMQLYPDHPQPPLDLLRRLAAVAA